MVAPNHEPQSAHYPTPEQLALLQAGPGEVIRSVVTELVTAAEYSVERGWQLGDLNNFPIHFCKPSFFTNLYREAPWRQRFAIMHPELTAELEDLVRPLPHRTVDESTDPSVALKFASAYDLMVHMVDRADQYVLRDDGTVDRYLLIG
ncbi:MAG: hypothetical protein ACREGB_03990 [Candidatus Saccharimonadales bacterium]